MTDIRQAVQDIRELTRMKAEIEEQLTAAQDVIKAEMTAQNVDELTGTDYRVTWKTVTSNRIDTTALKKDMPEIAQMFTRESSTRRFLVA